ncbi:MAG: type II toxin-antitoxin system HigB family toxin [Tepidisphaeraceae bacterium]|jgi:mRNA interferase HigB
MSMTVLNAAELDKAGKKNAPLRKALNSWLRATEDADWNSIQDVRGTFPSADGVAVNVGGGVQMVVTIFNIKGREYRLLTIINYSAATVLIQDVLTHAEYNKNQWKERL